jgi:TonB family protein
VNDAQKGIATSILLHGAILVAFFLPWVDNPIHTKTISLDFAFLNFQKHNGQQGTLSNEKHGRIQPDPKKGELQEKTLKQQFDANGATTSPYLNSLDKKTSSPDDKTGRVSDKDGYIETYGKTGSSLEEEGKGIGVAHSEEGGHGSAGGGHGDGNGRTIRYGAGGPDERTFHYIREGIIKNVKYPEKARRKGLAGKILLSFTVSGDGLTRDVKIISSSGFAELDNSAREAVLRTIFSQKIPYKLFVILPIEYRLE